MVEANIGKSTCRLTIDFYAFYSKEHQQEQIGKAGRARWMGRKPRVRGLAMNACDHPHGGGRGKSKGNKHPRSVYGWLTRGKRTRRPKDKDGNKMCVIKQSCCIRAGSCANVQPFCLDLFFIAPLQGRHGTTTRTSFEVVIVCMKPTRNMGKHEHCTRTCVYHESSFTIRSVFVHHGGVVEDRSSSLAFR